nr:amino acid decarboxylase [Clostridia bacterium]
MPGHKGRPVGLPFDGALEYDLTEIDSTGNLLDPSEGDVTDSTLEYMKRVYGTSATVMSAGGATLALQG